MCPQGRVQDAGPTLWALGAESQEADVWIGSALLEGTPSASCYAIPVTRIPATAHPGSFLRWRSTLGAHSWRLLRAGPTLCLLN